MAKTKSKLSKIKPLYIALSLIILLGIAYFLRLDNTIKELFIIPGTATENKKSYATYEHPLGFSIAYGKENMFPLNDCGVEKTKQSFIENDRASEVYIISSKALNRSDCSLGDNNLAIINSGRSKDIDPGFSMKYHYKKINSDEDLLELAKKAYGNGVVSLDKEAVPNFPGIYSVKIHYPEGQLPGVNFGYDFFYSEQNGVAVASQSVQECVFSTRLSLMNGFGDGCGSQILFP